MFIEQAFKGLTDWWRYIVGILIALVGVLVFSAPHAAAIFIKQLSGTVDLSKMQDSNYVMSLFESNVNLLFILLPFAGGLFGVFLAAKHIHNLSVLELTTTRKKMDWNRVWFVFFLWGIISSGLMLVDYFFISPEHYVFNFKPVPFAILCVIAIALIPLQTSFEEYLFRGYLMQGIGVSSRYKKFPLVLIYIVVSIIFYSWLINTFSLAYFTKFGIIILLVLSLMGILKLNLTAKLTDTVFYISFYKILNRNSTSLIITSLVFGLLHIANPEVDKLGYVIMVYYIGTGLFLGIITLMDDGMELALGFHAANNLFTALLVTADWTAFQTHSILKDVSDQQPMGIMEIFVPVFVIFPILLIILSKKYGWSNWKAKLFGKVHQVSNIDIIGNNYDSEL